MRTPSLSADVILLLPLVWFIPAAHSEHVSQDGLKCLMPTCSKQILPYERDDGPSPLGVVFKRLKVPSEEGTGVEWSDDMKKFLTSLALSLQQLERPCSIASPPLSPTCGASTLAEPRCKKCRRQKPQLASKMLRWHNPSTPESTSASEDLMQEESRVRTSYLGEVIGGRYKLKKTTTWDLVACFGGSSV